MTLGLPLGFLRLGLRLVVPIDLFGIVLGEKLESLVIRKHDVRDFFVNSDFDHFPFLQHVG